MWSILDFSRCADRHFVLTFVEVGCYARTFIAWILVAAALVSAIGAVAMILYGPSGTGSDPHVNWLRCPRMDLSIRSRVAHRVSEASVS